MIICFPYSVIESGCLLNPFNNRTHDNVQLVSDLLQAFKGSLPHPAQIHFYNMFQSVTVSYTRHFSQTHCSNYYLYLNLNILNI